jgi:diketogulonate reductase-like aldo/keto reductase
VKKEGRVRYIGVHVISDHRTPRSSRPCATSRSTSSASTTPSTIAASRRRSCRSPRSGRSAWWRTSPSARHALFQRAGTTPLPEWAAEFDARTWAQFFLKYVISHPAVTVVRAGTTKAKHMLDNIGGGIGRLPDEATRKRMVELVDSWPQVMRGGGKVRALAGAG